MILRGTRDEFDVEHKVAYLCRNVRLQSRVWGFYEGSMSVMLGGDQGLSKDLLNSDSCLNWLGGPFDPCHPALLACHGLQG